MNKWVDLVALWSLRSHMDPSLRFRDFRKSLKRRVVGLRVPLLLPPLQVLLSHLFQHLFRRSRRSVALWLAPYQRGLQGTELLVLAHVLDRLKVRIAIHNFFLSLRLD